MGWRSMWLVLAGVLLCSSGQTAFGGTSDIVSASFVPINAQMFRLRQPDGLERLFVRDKEEPNLFLGDEGWVAELDGRRALMMNENASSGERRGFMAVDGFLRKQLVGSNESDIQAPSPCYDPTAIAAFWPEASRRLVAAEAPDVWQGGSRLRLWFDNPNKAGLLFAELSIAVLSLLFFRSIWVKIVGVVLSLMAFMGLVQTSSRGALLALICGIAAMCAARFKSIFRWKRLLLIAVGAVVAIGYLYHSGQFDRMGRNLLNEGQRETSRLTVWKEVPGMMVDAPYGWGYGKSARAYIDWYQPRSECLLKDMISGHLTFLVESDWLSRIIYVSFWMFMLLVSFWQAVKGASPVPFAVIVVFAVAACFNPVVTVPELWTVPGAACVIAVLMCFRRGSWRGRLLFLGLSFLSATVVLLSVVVASMYRPSGVSVAKRGDAVLLNGTSPAVWIVDDDYVLHGGYWWLEGKSIRDYLRTHPSVPSIGFTRSIDALPSNVDRLVLIGEAGREFLACRNRVSAKEIVFISPPFAWTDVSASLRAGCEVRFIVGSHVARLVSNGAKPPAWVKVVRGVELYVPHWLDFVL